MLTPDEEAKRIAHNADYWGVDVKTAYRIEAVMNEQPEGFKKLG